MLNRMRVVTMLMLVLVVFALLQLISGSLFFSSIKANQDSFAVSNEFRVQQSEITSTWDYLLQTRINLSRASARMATDPTHQQPELINNARTTLAEADKHFNAYRTIAPQPSMEQVSQTINDKYQDYAAALTELIQFLESGNMDAYFAQATQSKQNALGTALRDYVAASDARNQEAYNASVKDYTFAKWQMGILALALAIVLVGVWYGIRHTLLNPLNRVIDHIRQIASGDLTHTLAIAGRSEITQLAVTVDHMQRSLSETVANVRQGSDAIYTGTSEIAMGNNDLSSRTEQQASALEETAASMEQLTATVKQNADNARQASQLANSASETAQRGGKVVDGVVKTMHDIAGSSKKIADIISVIDGIAFQTNILALNAAVEAARAGEQGRGFAVVASEVRTLASRSANAAKEIEGLISESVSLIDQGSGEVVAAGNTMSEIVEAVKRVTDIMLEIAAASDEQSRGIEQVSQAISEMDKVTQQNASLVEEASAAAASLEDQAARLTEAVGTFRLHGMTQSRSSNKAAPVTAAAPLRPAVADGDNWETF